MKVLAALFFVVVSITSVFGQGLPIRPGTIYCNKGSEAHPANYCIDSTPCKVVDGENYCLAGTLNPPAGATVGTASCWSMATDYTCLEYKDGCTTYSSDANCSQVGAATCTLDANGQPMLGTHAKAGQCQSYTKTYSCKDPRKEGSDYTVSTQCDTSGTQNGLNWTSTSESSDKDFIQAVTGQEIARELALYGQKDSDGIKGLFPGQSLGCREGYFGLKNCCKSEGGGAITNQTWASKIGMTVAMGGFKQGAGYAISKGSGFVYDSIYSSAPQFLTPGVESFFDSAISNSAQNAGFGAFGIGTTAEAAAGTFATTSSSMALGNTGLYFNPYALAAAVAIQLVMEAMSCTQDEMDLARARSQNLCHAVGSYCSQKVMVLGVMVSCLETTQTFCCYNGLLGKAIEEGAHSQLGLSWGSSESPNCAGLSPAQLTSLDFSTPEMQRAFEPFKEKVMQQYQSHTAPSLANGSVQQSVQQGSLAKTSALCLQRKKLDPSTVCS